MAESASIPVLHSYWRSSAAYRVRIALALKGQPYRSVTWQMAQGEHLQPAYRRLAPFGLVPMLDIDGLRLQQSLAIIEYLEERNPEPALLPPGRAARARARALAQLIACEVHPLNNLRALKRLRTQFGADDEQVGEWYRHWCHEAFSAFEAALGDDDGSPYALGDAPGIVECFLMPQVYNARRYGADLAPYGRIDAIARACAALPAFQAASPEHQPDAPQPAPPRIPPEPRSPIAVPRRAAPRAALPRSAAPPPPRRQTMQTEISAPGAAVAPAGRPLISADDRKVLAATLVGSTIEWYDYFIYSQAAGLVLGALFFAPSPRTIRNGR
ncbi:maleylacetoacetate isomerase [Achromobacter xylosoxidans]